MKITFNKNIELQNKAQIEKYLNHFSFLIPKWLQNLKIEVEPSDNPNLLASTCASEQYREASLTIRPLWFTMNEDEQSETIVHELCHLHTNPLYDFSLNAIRKYADGKDENQMQIVFDEMEAYLERQTQDLTFAIHNKFNE